MHALPSRQRDRRKSIALLLTRYDTASRQHRTVLPLTDARRCFSARPTASRSALLRAVAAHQRRNMPSTRFPPRSCARPPDSHEPTTAAAAGGARPFNCIQETNASEHTCIWLRASRLRASATLRIPSMRNNAHPSMALSSHVARLASACRETTNARRRLRAVHAHQSPTDRRTHANLALETPLDTSHRRRDDPRARLRHASTAAAPPAQLALFVKHPSDLVQVTAEAPDRCVIPALAFHVIIAPQQRVRRIVACASLTTS